MGKHSYEICINTLPRRSKNRISFTYDYCKTRGKNIQLILDRQAARISLELTASYDADALLSGENYIVSDAVKKAMLLYLIHFSENLTVRSMEIRIDGEPAAPKTEISENSPLVYSLIPGKLHGTIPEAWTECPEFLQALLSHSKSKMDSRWSSLYALLCAKSKTFEAERFVYLWMAFNGLYGYNSKLLGPVTGKKGKSQDPSEAEEIRRLLETYQLGKDHISKNDSKPIALDVISILRRYDISGVHGAKDLPEKLLDEIQPMLYQRKEDKVYNISAYGYLLADFAYYFRCNIIHADKPLPLYSYASDHELKCLHLINTLLEEFLDTHLHLLFTGSPDPVVKETAAAV